jgi:hypothetical protein
MLVAQTRLPVPGDALPGITPAEFQEFRLGLDDFLEVETSMKGWARRSTPQAAPCATACRRSAV